MSNQQEQEKDEQTSREEQELEDEVILNQPTQISLQYLLYLRDD
jgi:hypothetical protein